MPLLRYFGFAGGALVLLLFGLSWYFPQTAAEPIRSGINGPVIRISSVEHLPERVDIDNSLPTIVPPPSVLEFAERWPVANSVEITGAIVENPGPKPTTQSAGVPKKRNIATHEPVKKVVARRAAPSVNNAPISNYREQAEAPAPRLSLLDILKDRFGQNLFKLN